MDRKALRKRKLGPGVMSPQDPYGPSVPWIELPPLPAKKAWRLQELLAEMEAAYSELVEPWETRKAEFEEIYWPTRSASTYGELDQSSVARLVEDANLGPGHCFVDVGSGLGKLVVTVAAISEAKSVGVEISPSRHALGQRGLETLRQRGALTDAEAQRVKLFCGDCGEVLPEEVLQASHFILTMRRSTRAANSLRKALSTAPPLANGEPRVLWSVVHNLALKKGMTFNRRFVISGFELPRTLGPNDRQQSEGKVTQQMVVNEYLLAPVSSDA